PNVSMHVVDLRKRKFEDVFRIERPAALVHHAFVRHFRSDPRVRHEVNVLGTKRVLEYAIAYGVKRVVVLSSSYVYGALPDNPFYMNEDFPLNVSRTYPEVRDLAEVDTLATAFLWQHPEVTTAILRPVNTLGYYTNSAFRRLFRLGLYHTPPGAIDFLKYPCVLDGEAFQRAAGFTPLFSLEDTFASVRH